MNKVFTIYKFYCIQTKDLLYINKSFIVYIYKSELGPLWCPVKTKYDTHPSLLINAHNQLIGQILNMSIYITNRTYI